MTSFDNSKLTGAMPREAPVENPEGKRRSRRNAVRHGLCAETVIEFVEDVEDYKEFESAIIADYDAETAVERELALRLASSPLAHPSRDSSTLILCGIRSRYCASSDVRQLSTFSKTSLPRSAGRARDLREKMNPRRRKR